MNQNAETLVGMLERSELPEFNMHDWGTCGSPQCIGGWACHLRFKAGNDADNSTAAAREWLGLDRDVAEALFYPAGEDGDENGDTLIVAETSPWYGVCPNPWRATQPEAAQALRNACKMTEELSTPDLA